MAIINGQKIGTASVKLDQDWAMASVSVWHVPTAQKWPNRGRESHCRDWKTLNHGLFEGRPTKESRTPQWSLDPSLSPGSARAPAARFVLTKNRIRHRDHQRSSSGETTSSRHGEHSTLVNKTPKLARQCLDDAEMEPVVIRKTPRRRDDRVILHFVQPPS